MKHRARRRAAASDNTLPARGETPRAPAVEAFSAIHPQFWKAGTCWPMSSATAMAIGMSRP
jgi:hypothetical protein